LGEKTIFSPSFGLLLAVVIGGYGAV